MTGKTGSCCLWYLLPQGELCAGCPLVSGGERVQRNRAWMKKQFERPVNPDSSRAATTVS